MHRLSRYERLCQAQTLPRHLADRSHRMPYCDQHFPEYQAHRRRYNDMLYNHRHRRSSVPIPTAEEYWATVTWSPLRTTPSLAVAADVKSAIEESLIKLIRARGAHHRYLSEVDFPDDVNLPALLKSVDSIWRTLHLAGIRVEKDDPRLA